MSKKKAREKVRKKRANSSSLFLMELMVSIMFFVLAASLCIVMFVEAHIMSQNAKALNNAMNLCADAAELVRSCNTVDDAEKTLGMMYDSTSISEENEEKVIEVFYREDYKPSGSTGIGPQRLVISLKDDDSMLLSTISFINAKNEEVYHVDVRHSVVVP